MRRLLSFIFALPPILVLALSLSAEDRPRKAGKWRLTLLTEMTGVDVKISPMVIETCVKPEQVSEPAMAVPMAPDSRCTVDEVSVDGDTHSFAMACSEPPMTGHARITFREGSYEGEAMMRTGGEESGITTTLKFDGVWLGECSESPD